MSLARFQIASLRPVISVSGPATSSVSASGMSNGVRSSLAWSATIATAKPRRRGGAEAREEERDLVDEQLARRAHGTDPGEDVSRRPSKDEEENRRQRGKVEDGDEVAGGAEGRRAGEGHVEERSGDRGEGHQGQRRLEPRGYALRHDVLLGEQLDEVRERLEERGAPAMLPSREAAAVPPPPDP